MSKKEQKPKKGKPGKEAPEAEPQQGKKAKPSKPLEPPRLRVRYAKDIIPALMKHFSYKNVMAVPKLEKIVINMGLGEAIANAKILDVAVDELGRISGQRPVVTRAVALLRKSGGRVLGTVLNRRIHEIPGFIYRRI